MSLALVCSQSGWPQAPQPRFSRFHPQTPLSSALSRLPHRPSPEASPLLPVSVDLTALDVLHNEIIPYMAFMSAFFQASGVHGSCVAGRTPVHVCVCGQRTLHCVGDPVLFIQLALGGHVGCFHSMAIWVRLPRTFMHIFTSTCSMSPGHEQNRWVRRELVISRLEDGPDRSPHLQASILLCDSQRQGRVSLPGDASGL